MEWRVLSTPKIGTALFSFPGEGEHQLPLIVGDNVRIEEEFEGWYRGLHLSSNRRGIFPSNFVRLKNENKNVVSTEVIQVLREWESLLLKLYKERKMKEFQTLLEIVQLLLTIHRKYLSCPTETKRKELEDIITSKLEEGRRRMGLDVTIRTSTGEPATLKNLGVISLYNLHKEIAAKDIKQDRTSTIRKAQSSFEENLHLLVDLKIFMCSVGEPTELFISLYNKDQDKFLTEEYSVQLTGNGMPFDVEKINKMKTIFPLVAPHDLTSLYVIFRLVRKGKLLYENKKEKKGFDYRRPFGAAVLHIDDEKLSVISVRETEFTIQVYSSVQETQFANLHDLIIKKSNIQEVPRTKGICVGLSLLRTEQLESNPELMKIDKTNRLSFDSLILENKNDIFVTFLEGEVSQDRKTSAKNVEAILQVVTDTGEQIKECIHLGCETRSEYRTFILYHSNSPKWNERIRISIPDQPSHLSIMIRHCSTSESKEKSPFAAAFLPLHNPDGTGCRDDVHVLPCYKPPKVVDPVFYLKDKKEIRKGEFLKLRTRLISSSLTQNSSLLALWKWQDLSPQNLQEVLKQLTYIDSKELIRFLPKTFNALFSLLQSEGKNNAQLSVYNAIVFLIVYLIDEKKTGTNFKPILENYINQTFNLEQVHKSLINCLKHLFGGVKTEGPTKIIPTLKALDYIFKFIIASRKKFIQTSIIKEDIWFKHDLREVFDSFYELMKSNSGNLTGPQNIALKNVAAMFQDLGQIFAIQELSDIAKKFLLSIQYSEGMKLRNKEKLILLQKIVSSDLFLHQASRNDLLPIIIQQLKFHINGQLEELELCITILSTLLDSIQSKIKDTEPLSQLVAVIPEFLNVFSQPNLLPSSIRLDTITCFLSLLYLMEPNHFFNYLQNFDEATRTDLLYKLTKQMKDFLSTTITFPENWFALRLLPYITGTKVIVVSSSLLIKRVQFFNQSGPSAETEQRIWSEFFKLCILCLRASALAIENFPEAKQKLIAESTNGDLRTGISQILEKSWEVLDQTPASYHFVEQLVSPLLELMLINQPFVQKVAITLYYKLLCREFKETQSFSKVDNLTIYTTDRLVNDGTANEDFRILFYTSLQSRFSSSDALSTKGKIFLEDLNQFLILLLRSKEAEIEEFEDNRVLKMLEFMDYLKKTNRINHYIKYVHLLAEQHVNIGNFTEAGYTILNHANLLTWSDEILPEQGEFPSETQRQRKEKLYYTAMEYFDKGKNWEKSIELIKEFTNQYENVTFNYISLANILRLEASFFRKIITSERFFSPYFMVGYYGKGFDSSLSGKQFIHKGFELEGTSDFTSRLKTRFPRAEILKLADFKPPTEYLNNDGQFLHIVPVKASSKNVMEGNLEGIDPNMPPDIQSYYISNNTNVFLFSQPFTKSSTPSTNARNLFRFQDEWIRNYFFITEDSFPTVHRRTVVVKTSEVLVNPVDNVVTSLQEKSKELWEIINKYESEKESSQLTTVLRGAIESKVILSYKDAFLTETYLKENPQHKSSLIKLQNVISRLLEILEAGIAIHSKTTEDSVLQESLSSQFIKMKEELSKSLIF